MKTFGVMLDMSRNGVMKPEQVKKFAKVISVFGYNMLQLYTEDTYEVDGEPYFGYMRGRYTKAELKDIVSYCTCIGVEVVPCIQTLAHLNQIFLWEPYKPINDVADILLVGNERTYTLIENMFKTLRECYTTDKIHIGMDEAHMLGLGKYLDENGYRNRFDILFGHLKRVLAIAEKYGFKPMMWSDMFFRLANNGDYFPHNKDISKEVKDKTPREVDLVYWDYYRTEKRYYAKMLKAHKQFNNEIWFAGGAWSWGGFASKNDYSLATMKPAMSACKDANIENVLITMWGDNGKECSFYSLLPSLYAIRCFYDGNTNMPSIKAKFKELTGESFDAFMCLDLPNQLGKEKKPTRTTVCKSALYSDPFLGFLDSTLEEGAGVRYSRYARRLAKCAKTSAYGYLFDAEAQLCKVLALKLDLGVRTRRIYKEKNAEEWKALIQDYQKAEKEIELFIEKFRKLWFMENKPYGFEIQEQRLGGLLLRMRSCRTRLQEFSQGKIEKIAELEDSLLDFYGGGNVLEKKTIYYNKWEKIVSPNCI